MSFLLTDIDERDPAGRTPLMWAAAYGQAPTVSLLLRHGADVNAHGQEDETALHLAAARGHHDVARILVAAGGVVDAKDENRFSSQCLVHLSFPQFYSQEQTHLGQRRWMIDQYSIKSLVQWEASTN